jgi:hypothetical protein
MMLCRSDQSRSRIKASAMMDAKISGQIGQPAAWMSDHTGQRSVGAKREL